MRKLSLVAAALLMAFMFQPAFAQDGGEGGERKGRRFMHREWRGGPGMRGMRGMRGDRAGQRADENDDDDARGEREVGNFGMLGPRFMRDLGLTAEQKKQMIDIATENFRERLTLRWELAEARNALRDVEDSETPDYEAIIKANEALGGARGKLEVARRKVFDQFAAVLTQEQKDKIEEYRNGDGQDQEQDQDVGE